MPEAREFLSRPLAITDLETTHVDEVAGEIIDIGLLVVDQESLEVIHEFEARVKPEHPETASDIALKINGYNPEDWKDAQDLETALASYSELTEGAMLASWNYHFEAKFLDAACRKTGLPVGLGMDYHNRGIETFAAELLRNVTRLYPEDRKEILQRENMKIVAEFLEISAEPEPHSALEGARCAYRIYKRLRGIVGCVDLRFKVLSSGVFAVKDSSR